VINFVHANGSDEICFYQCTSSRGINLKYEIEKGLLHILAHYEYCCFDNLPEQLLGPGTNNTEIAMEEVVRIKSCD